MLLLGVVVCEWVSKISSYDKFSFMCVDVSDDRLNAQIDFNEIIRIQVFGCRISVEPINEKYRINLFKMVVI